jgi:dihydrofolate reductase
MPPPQAARAPWSYVLSRDAARATSAQPQIVNLIHARHAVMSGTVCGGSRSDAWIVGGAQTASLCVQANLVDEIARPVTSATSDA